MKVEIFLADCKLCEKFLSIMREIFKHSEIEIHRASECKDGSCCKRAEEVGVKAVPALVIDGKLVQTGVPDENEIEKLKRIAFSE